eukprot:s4251_g8.t1
MQFRDSNVPSGVANVHPSQAGSLSVPEGVSPSLNVNVPTMRETIDDSLLSDNTLPGQPLLDENAAASSSKSIPLEMQRPSSQPSQLPTQSLAESPSRTLHGASGVQSMVRQLSEDSTEPKAAMTAKELDNQPQLDGLPGERRPMVLKLAGVRPRGSDEGEHDSSPGYAVLERWCGTMNSY